MKKIILITGATGKQGRALIHYLLQSSTPSPSPTTTHQYHIYALTRNPSSLTAQSLLSAYGASNLTLVEGNLDERSSTVSVFEAAITDDANGNGIWGVFAVLAFPGLGASAEGEERQGKMLADIALEYHVQTFVYSSSMRAGPRYENKLDLKPSLLAKRNIEVHCRELGQKGLRWIILRPAFFMENFEGFIGSIAVAVLKKGMKEDTTLALIASEDIGNVAAGVFKNHETYLHKVLVLTSEFSTMIQIEQSYQNATDKPIPAIPGPLGWLLVKINKATQNLIKDMEQNHHARVSGEYPELEGEVELANSVHKMKTYYEWVQQGKKDEPSQRNWNQVSLGKLLTGRS